MTTQTENPNRYEMPVKPETLDGALAIFLDTHPEADTWDCREQGDTYLVIRTLDDEGDNTGLWKLQLDGHVERLDVEDDAHDDPRYDQDAIDNLDDARLADHLAERRNQLERARRDRQSTIDRLGRLTNPETPTYRDALATLSSYTREAHQQETIVRQLETEQKNRAIDRSREDDADARLPQIALVDEAIRARGLPLGVEDAEDTDLAAAIWFRATMALETESDTGQPTNVKVAERVADTYATLYGIR